MTKTRAKSNSHGWIGPAGKLEGTGGRRGPDLSGVGVRLTRDQLIDQISNGTPGGGNMPAYGKQMKPAEMTALVDFLVSLRPPGQKTGPPGCDRPTVTTASLAMNPTFDAVLRSWPFEPWVSSALLLTAVIYLRGWLALHRRDARALAGQPADRFRGWLDRALPGPGVADRAVHVAAAASPHAAAPVADDDRAALALAGCSAVPLAAGAAATDSHLLGRHRSFAAHRTFGERFETLTHPVPAWLLFTAATWFWHLPPIYELALAFGRLALSSAHLFPRHRRSCSGIRSSGRFRAGRAGRRGCSSLT